MNQEKEKKRIDHQHYSLAFFLLLVLNVFAPVVFESWLTASPTAKPTQRTRPETAPGNGPKYTKPRRINFHIIKEPFQLIAELPFLCIQLHVFSFEGL